jgi:hypothetical protein
MEASISSTNMPRRKSRWMFQPWIIRLYKIAGIVALSTILLALIAFVTVNVFYFFNETWVRPMILTEAHPRVIEARTQVDAARALASDLESERVEARAHIAEIDRLVATHDKFLEDVKDLVDKDTLQTINGALLRRQVDATTIERGDALDRKVTLTQRLEQLDGRIDEQRRVLDRLAGSPYVRALSGPVTMAFVPYANRDNVRVGSSLFGCSWTLVGCSKVGKVTAILDGEVSDVHPHDNSAQRGVMVEIELGSRSAAEDNVLFAGRKPLWIF